jgi:hypothetical protein
MAVKSVDTARKPACRSLADQPSVTQDGPLKTRTPAALTICLSMGLNIREWDGAMIHQ